MNPYHVLGVPVDADDRTIREAYLGKVRLASPESDPERFRALNEAYEKIRDERSRHAYELFDTACPGDSPLDTLIRHGRLQGPPEPPSLEVLKRFLRKMLAP